MANNFILEFKSKLKMLIIDMGFDKKKKLSIDLYSEFFRELKMFITTLGIDEKKVVVGCTEAEILAIENEINLPLPRSYKEYLKHIGRNSLFEFFNGEQASFEDLQDTNDFAEEILLESNYVVNERYFPFSQCRSYSFRFFYLNGQDDPEVLVFDRDSHDSSHISSSELIFTEMILRFFSQILSCKTASFTWVRDEELQNNENIVKDRFKNWFEAQLILKDRIINAKTNNQLVLKLYNRFFMYLTPENEKNIRDELRTLEKN